MKPQVGDRLRLASGASQIIFGIGYQADDVKLMLGSPSAPWISVRDIDIVGWEPGTPDEPAPDAPPEAAEPPPDSPAEPEAPPPQAAPEGASVLPAAPADVAAPPPAPEAAPAATPAAP